MFLAVGERLPVCRFGVRGGPVPARCPGGAGRDGGPRLGSRRAGCTPGRCVPARRCVIPAPVGTAGMIPPPVLAAMLAAATRSRCPPCPQCGQENTRPAGLGTRREHLGQVEEVPRSSTSVMVIPAAVWTTLVVPGPMIRGIKLPRLEIFAPN